MPARILFGTLVVITTLLAGGCAHDRWQPNHVGIMGKSPAPRLPAFLSGPDILLLSASGGFSARVVATSPTGPVSGQLVARAGRFFFEPSHATGRKSRTGQFSFIWDAAAGRGYVLSEALQGYAPIAATVSFTNQMAQSSPPATQTIDGHPVQSSKIVVFGSDGTQSKFEVLRATDLGGLPVRITLLDAPFPSTVTLSDIRLETSSDMLFLPPDGFTKYDTVDAMMDELFNRGATVQRGGGNAKPDEGAGRNSPPMGGQRGPGY